MYKKIARIGLMILFTALTVAVCQFGRMEAQAYSGYYASNCGGCHAAATTTTCNGCHHHGPASLKGTTDKTSYAPGETVSVTISGGSQSGWVRAILYDQNNTQVAISSGNASGMGHSTTFPAVLNAPAPTAANTYTWKVAWYGNSYDSSSPTASAHGEVSVSTNSFTVAAAPILAPTISSVTPATLVQGAANQNVTIAGANLTGAKVTFSNSGVTGGTATASATSVTLPVSVAAIAAIGAGTLTVTTASGSASSAFSVTKNSSIPTLSLSVLSDGSYTNIATLNVSGSASDTVGIKSVTINGQPVTVNTNGSFSTALTLQPGANVITVIATNNSGIQKSDTRTITYDPNAPVLTVSAPADNSSTTQSFITLTGTVNETSKVTVADNNGTPQTATMNGNNFSATVYLVPGINTISITATDLAGNIASAKRTVTYDSGSGKLTLAVTYPNQDITTSKSSLVLKGSVADSLSKVTVKVTMNGHTYTPHVDDGAFAQKLTFDKAKLYTIIVTATDATGNISTVTRNVIYRPASKHDDHHDDD
jgi:hypothetical protein